MRIKCKKFDIKYLTTYALITKENDNLIIFLCYWALIMLSNFDHPSSSNSSCPSLHCSTWNSPLYVIRLFGFSKSSWDWLFLHHLRFIFLFFECDFILLNYGYFPFFLVFFFLKIFIKCNEWLENHQI